MNYAIIGSGGFIAQRHKKCIEESGGKLLLTCDINPETNPDFLYYKEMFRSEKFKDVDAIVICTPNFTHHKIVRDSLLTNRKVLCEKPLIIDNDFRGLEGVNTVLQLRYHKFTEDIKKELKDKNEISLVMKVYRDEKWWNSWRGDQGSNGNILMQLAVHMIDYLIFILGDNYEVGASSISRKLCTGNIYWPNTTVNYHIEVLDNNIGQTRSFIINGKTFEMCNKDNLSFDGYHDMVYKDFINDNGIQLEESKKAINLINKL